MSVCIKQELLESSVNLLELSVRSQNCLKNLKINTIRELVLLTERDILSSQNCGKKSVVEIREKLQRLNLDLSMKSNYLNEISLNSTDLDIDDKKATNIDLMKINLIFFHKEIGSTDFSVRVKNYCEGENIKYVYELVRLSKKDLMGSQNLGKSSVKEIISKLNSKGLNLEMDLSQNSDEIEKIALIKTLKMPSPEMISESLDSFLEYDKALSVLTGKAGANDLEIEKYYSTENMDQIIVDLINTFFIDLNDCENKISKTRIFTLEKSCTLEELGTSFNKTRERVRQVEKKLWENLRVSFSSALAFINACIGRMNKIELDPFEALKNTKQYLNERNAFLDFLSKIGIEDHLLQNLIVTEVTSEILKIRNEILLNYEMPLTEFELNEILRVDYGMSKIQISSLLEDHSDFKTFKRGSQIFIDAPTKSLAVANIALRFPQGAPWHDLAEISKATFEKCKNIRTSPCADESISQNPYLYLYDRGTYRHIKFYNVSSYIESSIENEVYEYIKSMKEEIKPLQIVKDELKIQLNLYDLLHLLKDRSNRFHFQTKSGRMLIVKDSQNEALGYSVKNIVTEFMIKKTIPVTSFEVKDSLTSGTEGHASFVLSLLVEDGSVIRYDGARYSLVSALNQSHLETVKDSIKSLILKTNKILVGSYLKEQIELANNFQYSRFFYSSIAQIVCRENGFFWVRHSCSKIPIEPGFSLKNLANELALSAPDSTFESFKTLATERLEIDQELLLTLFYKSGPIRKLGAA